MYGTIATSKGNSALACKQKGDFMDRLKLKKVVEDTVEKVANDHFEDMVCHPWDYDWFDATDEDECWVQAVNKARDEVWADPTSHIDEDVQEEMTEENWHEVYSFLDGISWLTYAAKEVQRAFAQGVAA